MALVVVALVAELFHGWEVWHQGILCAHIIRVVHPNVDFPDLASGANKGRKSKSDGQQGCKSETGCMLATHWNKPCSV